MDDRRREVILVIIALLLIRRSLLVLMMMDHHYYKHILPSTRVYSRRRLRYNIMDKIPKQVEHLNDAVNEVLNDEAEINETDVDMPINEDFLPNYNPTEAESTNSCDTASGSGSNLARNKRKAVTSLGEDDFMEVISGLIGKTDEILAQIVKSLGSDEDDKIARQSVFEMLDVFPMLTMTAKVQIGRRLAKDKEELDFFLSLPHEARLEFITQMIREL